jgi:hypothetical protein
MNPLEKFNLILQGNYVDPGFRQPSDSQMPMQNLFNTQQFSQDVANDKAQQDLIAKQQQDFRKANMLIALGDALKGKDVGQGLMQRQQFFQQQEEKRQAKLQEKEINKAIDAANLPESQKQLLKQLDPKTQASILFREPEPEPGKQAIIDSILRKKLLGEELTEQENQLYQDLVLRPTYQERVFDSIYRTQGFNGPSQSSFSVIPTITTEEQFNNLPSGSEFYFEGKLQTKE